MDEINDTEIYESFGKKLKEMNFNELEIKIDENKNIIGVSFSK